MLIASCSLGLVVRRNNCCVSVLSHASILNPSFEVTAPVSWSLTGGSRVDMLSDQDFPGLPQVYPAHGVSERVLGSREGWV